MMVLIATRFSDSRVTGLKKLPIRISEPIHGRKNNEHVECQRSPLALTCVERQHEEVLAGGQHRDYIIKEGFAGGKLLRREISNVNGDRFEIGVIRDSARLLIRWVSLSSIAARTDSLHTSR